MQLKEGEVLGHECMGIVEATGPRVTKVKVGDRVVAAFNIACGSCQYCKKQQYTACECTNNSSVMEKLYGHRIAGVLGYSHVSSSIRNLTLNEPMPIKIIVSLSSWVVSLEFRQSMPASSLAIPTCSRFPTTYPTKRHCTFLILSLQLTMLFGKPVSRKEK
jgi:hypothetical protein